MLRTLIRFLYHSPIGRAVIPVMMYVITFKTDGIVFISNIIKRLTSVLESVSTNSVIPTEKMCKLPIILNYWSSLKWHLKVNGSLFYLFLKLVQMNFILYVNVHILSIYYLAYIGVYRTCFDKTHLFVNNKNITPFFLVKVDTCYCWQRIMEPCLFCNRKF